MLRKIIQKNSSHFFLVFPPPSLIHHKQKKNMENILLALSNMPAVPAVFYFAQTGAWIQCIVVALAALASTFYHLIECHKHDMPSVALPESWLRSRQAHDLFINIDRVAAYVAVGACWYTAVIIQHPYIILTAGVSIILSEVVSDMLPKPWIRYVHVTFHTIWHSSMFLMAAHIAVAWPVR